MKDHIFKSYFIGGFGGMFLLILASQHSLAEPVTDLCRATIHPSLVKLERGEEQQFKVVMAASYLKAAFQAEEVKWAVNDIPGGNKELGTISANGLYRAPPEARTPHEIHICAEVEGAANRYLWATVLMGNPVPSYRLVRSWGESAERPTNLVDPHGICLDADGNILIADQGSNRVLRYTPDGKFLGDIGLGEGNEPGQFTAPRVVEIDSAGRIWVSDSKGDRPRIQVFTPEGKFLRIFAEKGIGPGQLLRAHGMGFDKDQRLFVTDVDNFRVSVYSHSGEFLYNWGKVGVNPGEFNAPHGMFVDANGDCFVPGYYGPTQKFDGKGDFLFGFAHGDPPDGPTYFHALNGDRRGNVYLMVRTSEGYGGALPGKTVKRISIAKYNNNGDFITSLSLSDPNHRESWAAVDADGIVYSLFRGEKEVGVEVFAPQ